jgi:hypothetical protein
VLAGALSRMHIANGEAGRCFPYRWWKEKDGTLYAMKIKTAEIFDKALKSAAPESS